MTQEEKQLLLQDLAARLPYEIILLSSNEKITYQTDGNTAAELLVEEGWKPYLRPMSNMTEDEEKEYYELYYDAPQFKNGWRDAMYLEGLHIDWLNAHHFDYRGLIKKGLAIAVTEENNPYEN